MRRFIFLPLLILAISSYAQTHQLGDLADRQIGSYQEDNVGQHGHNYIRYSVARGSNDEMGYGDGFSGRKPSISTTDNPTVEARPKNIAFYLYIKINE